MNSKITKITIGRLFNLGSYEHVRYELTAEVAEGESAFQVLSGMERILNALSPKRPPGVDSEFELKRKELEISKLKAMDGNEYQQEYEHYEGNRREATERIEKAYLDSRIKARDWVLRCENARELLEDLGGAAVWKVSKLQWEEYGEF